LNVRAAITAPKKMSSDTGWKDTDMPPKHAPIYTKSRPSRAGWKWRSAKADNNGREYVLVTMCHPSRGNWKSMLIEVSDQASRVIGRFEYHSTHPGLHGHANCNSSLAFGSVGLDDLTRYPSNSSFHRRKSAWTENGFWEASKRFFRVEESKGSLI
jgi:hypothetical protein